MSTEQQQQQQQQTKSVFKYLNSLSDKETQINLNNRQLTSVPDLSRFKNLVVLNVSNNNLTSIPVYLPDTLKELIINNNYLKFIPDTLPKGLEQLKIFNNPYLSELYGRFYNDNFMHDFEFTQERRDYIIQRNIT